MQDDDAYSRTPQVDSAEVLDGVITSRGEIRHTGSPKVTSLIQTPIEGMTPVYSPRVSQRGYSPRSNKLRVDKSPKSLEKGLQIKKTPSPGPSILGQTSNGSSPC